MYIGELTHPDAGTQISYRYCRRGTTVELAPDFPAETAPAAAYGPDGRIFTDFVGYHSFRLLYGSVDVCISLGRPCFVDHITFEQTEISAFASLVVLVGDRPVGRLDAQTGGRISSRELAVELGVETDSLILRFTGLCRDVVIGHLKLMGAVNLSSAVYPIPRSMVETGGLLSTLTGITAEGEDAAFAAAHFAERYADRFGSAIPTTGGNISFALADTAPEAFTVSVTADGITVRGGSRRALLYAAERLLQLCSAEGVRCAEIDDAPFMGFRGFHLALPDRAELPFLRRVIKYLLLPMGYNAVILQLSGAMEYERHPEINDAWRDMCRNYPAGKWPLPAHYHFIGHDVLTQDEVRELCAYMRSYGLEVIPEVQSFAHAQHITLAYPDMAEDEVLSHTDFDLTNEDARPDRFYAHSMCPNHPDYYKVIFDLIDESVAVVQPERYVHIGHDEIYTIGKCPRCRDMHPADIYTREVTALHDHIAELGLTTMMWSDMIQERKYASSAAIDRLPRDIVCLSFTWYFHVEEDNEDVLCEHGYPIMIGNFYSSHFTRFTTRRHKPGLLGAEVSTWVSCNPLSYGHEGKFYDLLYSANMLWNAEHIETLRRTNNALVMAQEATVMPEVGVARMDASAEALDFAAEASALPYDLREAYRAAASVGAGERLTIPVGGKAERFSFLHATDDRGERIMWAPPQKLGAYVITYTDGSCVEAELLYGANIAEYRRSYGCPLGVAEGGVSPFRHEGYFAACLTEPICGKTAAGEDYTLCRYTVVNPHPEREVAAVTLTHDGETGLHVLLFGAWRS